MDYFYQRAGIEDIELLVGTRTEVLRAANGLDDSTDMTEVETESRFYYERALKDGSHTAWLVFDGSEFIGSGGISYYNVMPTYQVLKAMLKDIKDISFNKDKFMVVSPDEGALNRNMYYASVLGVEMGMFYKRRDYSTIVNGRNPIVAHEYLGNPVEGKDVFVSDDIISSGESMLDVASALKEKKAGRFFAYATYAIFTNGLEKFDKAYEDGIIDGVFGTNLTYRTPELLSRPWFHEVDVSKYIAYFIEAINHDVSISKIIDPHIKIETLLKKYGMK